MGEGDETAIISCVDSTRRRGFLIFNTLNGELDMTSSISIETAILYRFEAFPIPLENIADSLNRSWDLPHLYIVCLTNLSDMRNEPFSFTTISNCLFALKNDSQKVLFTMLCFLTISPMPRWMQYSSLQSGQANALQ